MSLVSDIGVGADSLEPADGLPAERSIFEPAIRFRSIKRSEPRPLSIHVLQIDLQASEFELAVAVGEDPDGDGPIEATLTPPRALASRARLVAAVNANAWSMMPPKTDGLPTPYLAGLGCDIAGWAVVDGEMRSTPRAGNWNLWLEKTPRVRLGERPETETARQAAAGFGGLIRRGAILPSPSEVRHPRTAAGTDREGRWLWLVVVDGRQPGYSEGMSERELADWMADLGCVDAINLDGGGSSVLLLADEQGRLGIRNRPSDRLGPRPVPVVLGVRRRSDAGTQ